MDERAELNYIAKMLWRAAALTRKEIGDKEWARRLAKVADQTARSAHSASREQEKT